MIITIVNVVTWIFILFNFQMQMVNLALSDVYYATLAVGRGDDNTAHRLSKRARRIGLFGWPLRLVLPQAERLKWR